MTFINLGDPRLMLNDKNKPELKQFRFLLS